MGLAAREKEVYKMLYAGLDVHKRTTYVTVVDEAGNIVKWEQVSSSAEGIREALGHYRRPVKAALEASHNWGRYMTG